MSADIAQATTETATELAPHLRAALNRMNVWGETMTRRYEVKAKRHGPPPQESASSANSSQSLQDGV